MKLKDISNKYLCKVFPDDYQYIAMKLSEEEYKELDDETIEDYIYDEMVSRGYTTYADYSDNSDEIFHYKIKDAVDELKDLKPGDTVFVFDVDVNFSIFNSRVKIFFDIVKVYKVEE